MWLRGTPHGILQRFRNEALIDLYRSNQVTLQHAGLAWDFYRFLAPLVAFLLAGVIGWNREEEEHNVGVRSFPIVAMASCTFVMIATFHGDPAAQSRVLQGLVAGIGFVGGGAIMKDGLSIKGTATAASVLSAAAWERRWHWAVRDCREFDGLNLVALRALMPIKNKLDRGKGRKGD